MRHTFKTVLLTITAFSVFAIACVKGKFDAPLDASNVDPGLTVTTTISALKAKYSSAPVKITEDLTIYGIVTANDKSGNFYKQIIIQDATSGIPILLEKNGLAGEYPVGRKVYIKCKGLTLSAYGNFVQLGYDVDNTGSLAGIPNTMIGNYVVKANYPVAIPVKKVSVGDINVVAAIPNDWYGTVIEIDSAEFINSDKGVMYAQPSTLASGTDRKIKDCSNNQVVLRNSAYAQFQAMLTPSGRGPIRAILSRYNSTPQLLINDVADLNFTGPGCPFGTGSETPITIADLKTLFTTSGKQQLFNYKLSGTVISDIVGNNLSSNKNLFLQSGDKGIVVRFASASDNTWQLGDSIEILINGDSLMEFSGLLQIGPGLGSNKVRKVGTGTVVPRVATIADIAANFEAWESTLVKIVNVDMTPANPTFYSTGNSYMPMDDGTNATYLNHYTSSFATFKDAIVPTTPKTYIGILWQNASVGNYHFSIRNLNDVQ